MAGRLVGGVAPFALPSTRLWTDDTRDNRDGWNKEPRGRARGGERRRGTGDGEATGSRWGQEMEIVSGGRRSGWRWWRAQRGRQKGQQHPPATAGGNQQRWVPNTEATARLQHSQCIHHLAVLAAISIPLLPSAWHAGYDRPLFDARRVSSWRRRGSRLLPAAAVAALPDPFRLPPATTAAEGRGRCQRAKLPSVLVAGPATLSSSGGGGPTARLRVSIEPQAKNSRLHAGPRPPPSENAPAATRLLLAACGLAPSA